VASLDCALLPGGEALVITSGSGTRTSSSAPRGRGSCPGVAGHFSLKATHPSQSSPRREAVHGNSPKPGTLHRQTSLPPVSEGRASGAALRAPSPPSARGVCLVFSSGMGPLTTMTGSELAGHRLLGSARHVVLRTTLLARRGGARPSLKQTPPPGAPRLLAHTFGVHAPALWPVAIRT